MFTAIGSLTLLGLTLGVLLGLASRYLKVETPPIINELESMLPGSQCGQCGYPGCSQAAAALAEGAAPVTLCPPGGKALAQSLAEKLGVNADLSGMEDGPPKIAQVNEQLCIGCIKCLRTCPTDAIVGAPKQLHMVMEVACTGCGVCVDNCPTGSISMVPEKPTLKTWHWAKPELNAA